MNEKENRNEQLREVGVQVRQVSVAITVGFGETEQEVEFVVDVPDDWEHTPETESTLYDSFRADCVLNIESVECAECGQLLAQCECGEEEE